MPQNSALDFALRYLRYTLSLPERTIRALASLAAGATTLLTENLLPASLRRTMTYQITFGMMQRFVVEQIAGIQREAASEPGQLAQDYTQRKIAGTVLEAAGLLTVGASPLWLFAIAGDAAGGSRVFLERLITHLKTRGIVPEEAQAASLVDVLDAVQQAASTTAAAIDMPPLSRRELNRLAENLKRGYGDTFRSTANLLPKLEKLWQRMERTAEQEKVSLDRLVGVMTVDALSRGAGTIVAAGSTSYQLFDDHILDSYRETLEAVARQGLSRYIATHYQPFLQAVKKHFDASRLTWTERSIGGKPETD